MTGFLRDHLYELFWALAVLCLLWLLLHHRKRVRAFLLGSAAGLASLLLLHQFGDAIGFAPTLSLTNLTTAGLLGVPGTLLLMAAHYFT
jgi:hypothetical protein